MKLLTRAVLLLFAGIVIGAAHSYYAPVKLRPDNNPEVDPGLTGAPSGSQQPPDTTPPDTTPPDPAPPGSSGTDAGENTGAQDPPPPAPQDDPPPAPPAPEPNYFVDLDRAKQLLDQGQQQHNVVFVDARPAKDYSALHIAGAMHLPPEAFVGRPPQKAIDFLPGMTVVIYCHGALCTDSERVMIGLQELKRDIKPIYIMKDGFDPWRARGWPAEAGPDQFGP